MTPPGLVILGYSEAAMLLRRTPAPRVGAIISVHGRREFGVEADVPRRLDLAFDDVEVPEEGDLISLQRTVSRRRWAEANGLSEVPPTVRDAAAIVAFAGAVRDVDGVVLCHCGGGMSRAPAAGLICLAVWRGAGAEGACVAEVLRVRNGAVPHAGLVRLADGLLGRGGRLVRAVMGARDGGRGN